jgi:hypothetical protein
VIKGKLKLFVVIAYLACAMDSAWEILGSKLNYTLYKKMEKESPHRQITWYN